MKDKYTLQVITFLTNAFTIIKCVPVL